MKTFARFQLLVMLGLLPYAASAELYKCKKADGSNAYQDTPCATGATQQVIKTVQSGGGSVLIDSMAESNLIGLRSNAHKTEQEGRAAKGYAACMRALDSSKLHGAYEAALKEHLDAREIKSANEFFGGQAGKKYAKRMVVNSYTAIGENPPEPLPVLTADENREVMAFLETSAGDKLVKRKVMLLATASQTVYSRMQELRKNCGARQ